MLNIHFLGENALFADIGKIFHPLFLLFGWILAGIYSVIPNYGVAIAGLTIVIMLCLTPVNIKSTRSMIAMQRLQPEMKKLQAKYKGSENREQLNQEMMKLYKENGTSPFGACLPMFLQIPFLIVLYSLIRGLSFTQKIHGVVQATPRYIDSGTRIYQNLVSSFRTSGLPKATHMHWFFGMDLSQALAQHTMAQIKPSLVIPYLILHRRFGLPAVLPNEADEQPESGGCGGQSADANHAEGISAYLRCLLPKSAGWSRHLHAGFFRHADRHPRGHVPHWHGDAGGGRT